MQIRNAIADDLPAITEIYNHEVLHDLLGRFVFSSGGSDEK